MKTRDGLLRSFAALGGMRRCAAALLTVTMADAAWSSTGVVQLPIHWVAVEGSPIAETGDHTELLVTRTLLANFFMTPAGITLLPAGDAAGTIPIIDDPNLPNATELSNGAIMGDVDADFSGIIYSREVREIRRGALREIGLGFLPVFRPVLGIATGRFNRDDGTPRNLVGWGSRVRNWFMVEDPRRRSLTIGGMAAMDPLPLAILDNDAQLVSHEVGHVLTLDHRMASDAIMAPQLGSAPPGVVPGFGLGEQADMRTAARRISNAFVDPPGVFESGPVVGQQVLDLLAGDEHANPPPEFVDLSVASTRWDREANLVSFEQELWGLIPEASLTDMLNYWTLIDVDNNQQTGAPAALLAQFGLSTNFNGAELAMRASVSSNGQQLTTAGDAWEFVGNQVVMIPKASAMFSVERDVLEPVYAAGATPPNIPETFPVTDVIVVQLDNGALQAPLVLGSPFKMQMVLEQAGPNPMIWDRLDEQEQGLSMVFENPTHPNAVVVDGQGQPIAGQFKPGEMVSAIANGLVPSHPIEVFVGATLVAQGTAGPNGDASAQFAVAAASPPGMVTMTFVSSGTAVAAGNVFTILPPVDADFNDDNLIDATDLAQWRSGFGLTAAGDADDDGDSDGADFLAWQQQLGSVPAAPAAGAVPEPAAVVMLLAAPLLWPLRRRRPVGHPRL